MKNEKLREVMFRKMVTQSDLAEILGVRQEEISYALKYELSDDEQNRLIAKIYAWLEEEKGA